MRIRAAKAAQTTDEAVKAASEKFLARSVRFDVALRAALSRRGLAAEDASCL
jgi:hypothetical protein